MSVFKRILIFPVSFLLLGIGIHLLAFLYLAVTLPYIGDAVQASAEREAAALAFISHYSLWVILSSLVLAASISFRGIGAIIGGILAIVLSLTLQTSTYFSALSGWVRKSHVTAPAPLAGRHARLITPITLHMPYGAVVIPAGTSVMVVEENGDAVWISVLDGRTAMISRSSLE